MIKKQYAKRSNINKTLNTTQNTTTSNHSEKLFNSELSFLSLSLSLSLYVTQLIATQFMFPDGKRLSVLSIIVFFFHA